MVDSSRFGVVKRADVLAVRAIDQPEVISTLPESDMKERVKRFVSLVKQKRTLEEALKRVNDELNPLSEKLAEEFIETGTQSEKVDGYTAYMSYRTWASPVDGDYPRLCEALKAHGYADIVKETVSVQTLSALVTEKIQEAIRQDQDEDTIFPPEIMQALKITHVGQLRARKSP